jgi:hypothetical protein
MKRRSFLSLSALSAVPVAARAADEEPDADGWGTINEDALEFTAVTDDGNITLLVELFIPPEEEVTQAMDEKGEHRCYQYKGKDMPGRFWPGQSLLTRFDLTWDGKRIPIAERFWNDLAGLRIQTSTLDPEKLAPQLQWKAQQFLTGLWRPRLSTSADGGTILIEWERPEECDGRSMIRWIVSKSGTVLRHRHCPPHEC